MAKPNTHKLIVTYKSGRTESHPFPSKAQAEKERAEVAMVSTVVETKVVDLDK